MREKCGAPVALGRVVTHPLWLFGLALLIINDHLLKGSGLLPGVVTGKLSDVAGMFVAPVVLAALLCLRSRFGLAVAHVAVGAGFTVMELSDHASVWTDQLLRLVGLRWVATRDLSDLLVLPLLLISYYACRAVGAGIPSARPRRSEISAAVLPRVLVAVGLLASVASGGPPPQSSCQGDCDQDGFDDSVDCNDFDWNVNPAAGNCPGEARNEDCENGIDDDGDGATDCDDSDCNFACADSNAACAFALPVDPLTQTVVPGSTLGGSYALEGPCGGADAPEAIFQLPAADGSVRITVPDGHVVYARSDCGDALSSFLCSGDKSVDLDLRDGGVTLVVDATDALEADDFELELVFIPTGCGDGSLGRAEECDDHDNVAGDGCAPNCVIELREP